MVYVYSTAEAASSLATATSEDRWVGVVAHCSLTSHLTACNFPLSLPFPPHRVQPRDFINSSFPTIATIRAFSSSLWVEGRSKSRLSRMIGIALCTLPILCYMRDTDMTRTCCSFSLATTLFYPNSISSQFDPC